MCYLHWEEQCQGIVLSLLPWHYFQVSFLQTYFDIRKRAGLSLRCRNCIRRHVFWLGSHSLNPSSPAHLATLLLDTHRQDHTTVSTRPPASYQHPDPQLPPARAASPHSQITFAIPNPQSPSPQSGKPPSSLHQGLLIPSRSLSHIPGARPFTSRPLPFLPPLLGTRIPNPRFQSQVPIPNTSPLSSLSSLLSPHHPPTLLCFCSQSCHPSLPLHCTKPSPRSAYL